MVYDTFEFKNVIGSLSNSKSVYFEFSNFGGPSGATFKNCSFINSDRHVSPIFSFERTFDDVTFEDSYFEGDTWIAGGSYQDLSNILEVTVRNCTFKNMRGFTAEGESSIFKIDPIATNSVLFKDITIIDSDAQLLNFEGFGNDQSSNSLVIEDV